MRPAKSELSWTLADYQAAGQEALIGRLEADDYNELIKPENYRF